MGKIRVTFITKCSALGNGVLNTFKGNGKFNFLFIPFKNFSSLSANHTGKNSVIIFSDIGFTNDEYVLVHKFVSDKSIIAKKILYTASFSKDYLVSFIMEGTHGIVSTNDELALLKDAVLGVSGGNIFFSDLIREICQPKIENYNLPVMPALTNREAEIVEHLKQGKSRRQIAENMFIDIKTVDSHLCRILRKFNVKKLKELKLILVLKVLQLLLIIIPLISQDIT